MEFQPSERPPLPPPFAPEPVLARERIVTLDVIRGIAILGILVVNIQTFAMIDAAMTNPTAQGPIDALDLGVWHAMHVFFEGKFHTIFSALFGAGILLMTERAAHGPFSPMTFHFRRMAGLFVIGMIHAYFIWHGDILVAYALCGCFVVWFRTMRARWLVPLAACMLLVPPLIFFGSYTLATIFPEHALEPILEAFHPSEAEIQEQIAAYQGPWLDQMPSRVLTTFYIQTVVFAIYTFWRAAAVMLLGMVLFRAGVLSGARSTRFYVVTLLLAGMPGLVIVEIGARMFIAREWDPLFYLSFGHQFNYWGSLLVAMAWIALGVLITRIRLLDRLTAAFAAVGRTALTNYLMQSVICTWIFYGHGLGWYGRTEHKTQVLVVIGVWVVQLIVSPLWLRVFRFGPVEYLWRWATYGRRPPNGWHRQSP
jgi:uncharacterized protein